MVNARTRTRTHSEEEVGSGGIKNIKKKDFIQQFSCWFAFLSSASSVYHSDTFTSVFVEGKKKKKTLLGSKAIITAVNAAALS